MKKGLLVWSKPAGKHFVGTHSELIHTETARVTGCLNEYRHLSPVSIEHGIAGNQ